MHKLPLLLCNHLANELQPNVFNTGSYFKFSHNSDFSNTKAVIPNLEPRFSTNMALITSITHISTAFGNLGESIVPAIASLLYPQLSLRLRDFSVTQLKMVTRKIRLN
ncbi:hypothetical protein [Nostoc sp.]|uniref:hypothetical protein n=2 Tax=Nostoc sp. TaxID=1180 RepID=UPI002FF93986